jgi:hypothetical protein
VDRATGRLWRDTRTRHNPHEARLPNDGRDHMAVTFGLLVLLEDPDVRTADIIAVK